MEYGLIGEKLSHSFSEAIHGMLCAKRYERKEIPRGDLDRFMREKPFEGINVTIPYKEEVIAYCDALDPAAAAIGAVNTIVNRGGRLTGYNTDFTGLSQLAQSAGISFTGKTVLILGTGGTAKTARAVASSLGAAQSVFVSRSGAPHTVGYARLETHAPLREAQILINTTPVGMYPNAGAAPVDLAIFTRLEGVLDCIFNPLRTELVLQALERGIPAAGGLLMLVSQAKAASEKFQDQPIPNSRVDEIYQTLAGRLCNVCLIGMPGAGKTTVGQQLAQRLGKTFVDTDALVTQAAGCPISEIFRTRGEEAFRMLETQALQKAAMQNGQVIATGGGVVKRPENLRHMRQNGPVVFLERPIEQLELGKGRPLSQSAQDVRSLYAQRLPLYREWCDFTISNHTYPQDAAGRAAVQYNQWLGRI